MALGKESGEFSFKVTSTTFSETGAAERGGFHVQINLLGTATGGTVEGTLTLTGEPGAKSGTGSFRGANFLDDGNIIGGTGEGTWETVGNTNGAYGESITEVTGAPWPRMANWY